MLDPKFLRGNLDELKAKLATRGYELDIAFWQSVEEQRKSIQVKTEELQAQKNAGAKKVGELKRNGEDATELMNQMQAVSEAMKTAENELRDLQATITNASLQIPNIPADDVPVGNDENDNVEVRRWGVPRAFDFEIKDHTDVAEQLGMLDFEMAAKLTGARFSVLKGAVARLNRALIQFMLDTHTTKYGYTEMYVPYMVNADSLQGTGQLPKFEEDLFKLRGDKEYYLIPTSEVPLTNSVRDTILSPSDLPIKLTAHTPCFRSEAGSAGRDTRGLIRMHQFNKVELVKFTKPEESWAELDKLTNDAEEVLQLLGLPYHVVRLCTGDLGFSSATTYDLEVWLPAANCYREISSCSNFLDFQARRANIRFRRDAKSKPEFVHTLNGSGVAVGRTVAAILENYQQADGSVVVPEVLRPYMGCDVIPAPKK